MSQSKMREAWIMAGLYLTIMIECATVGLLFHATLAEFVDHSQMKVDQRSSQAVIILTFVAVALIGYTLTIPCLCYGAQRHSPSALIPYLVWRMLLSSIIVIIILWQAMKSKKSPPLFRAAFYNNQLPVALGEVLIGFVFFAISFQAYREFQRSRMVRDKTPEPDVFA